MLSNPNPSDANGDNGIGPDPSKPLIQYSSPNPTDPDQKIPVFGNYVDSSAVGAREEEKLITNCNNSMQIEEDDKYQCNESTVGDQRSLETKDVEKSELEEEINHDEEDYLAVEKSGIEEDQKVKGNEISRRGRPPKKRKSKVSAQKKNPVDSNSSSSNSGKRPRGRPRKHPKPEDANGGEAGSGLKKVGMLHSVDDLSPRYLFSQLCLVAADSTKQCSSLPKITSFFAYFRGFVFANPGENQEPGKKTGKKRGRKKKAMNSDDEPETDTEYMPPDTYWSDITLEKNTEQRRKIPCRGRRRRVDSEQNRQNKKAMPAKNSLLTEPPSSNKQEVVGEMATTANSDEKIKEESHTAMILTFADPDAIPCEPELIKIFSHFGPLCREETEVLRSTGHAKVVFKYREDGDEAYSSARKDSIFGPAPVSYRLRYSD